MYGGIEGWSQFDPTGELLELRWLKKFLLVLIDGRQNTQCIDADRTGPSSRGGSCPGRILL